ncbi:MULTISPECIES: helix-turn-helix transcriptional regulator [unclassified Lactobacillus]|uniref:helix-turn-helix transcriptional regulator n=1 Tax=unclassified Lactobacillus TaxID=2620435 RepID=UPI002269E7FC|nr:MULTISPECIES: PAS domain-containing protein [unclassified Lactobacillus]
MSHYLGEGYEIVLHSLENYDKSIIAICNGNLRARTISDPITELALHILEKIEAGKLPDNYMTYFNRNSTGEPIKGMTVAIRGNKDRIIGLLCINFYLNTPFTRIMGSFIPQHNSLQHTQVIENFDNSTEEVIAAAVNRARASVNVDTTIKTKNKNKEIILRLKKEGIFGIKKAIPAVYNQLNISKNTIYLHLRNSENK